MLLTLPCHAHSSPRAAHRARASGSPPSRLAWGRLAVALPWPERPRRWSFPHPFLADAKVLDGDAQTVFAVVHGLEEHADLLFQKGGLELATPNAPPQR